MSLAFLNQLSCQCVPNPDLLVLAHRHNLVTVVVEIAAEDLYDTIITTITLIYGLLSNSSSY